MQNLLRFWFLHQLNVNKTELNTKKHQYELQITRETQIIIQNELLQKKYLDEVEDIYNENSLNIYIIMRNYFLNQINHL